MPLIEINQSRPVSATIRLESATATLIDQYATFLHAPADDVVDKALNYVFSKDREFQEYLKTAQSSDVVPTLRVRRSGNVMQLSLLPMAGGPLQGWRCAMRSVARPLPRIDSYPEVLFGASHRVYLDTPPLVGRCRDTLVSRQIPLTRNDFQITRYPRGYRKFER